MLGVARIQNRLYHTYPANLVRKIPTAAFRVRRAPPSSPPPLLPLGGTTADVKQGAKLQRNVAVDDENGYDEHWERARRMALEAMGSGGPPVEKEEKENSLLTKSLYNEPDATKFSRNKGPPRPDKLTIVKQRRQIQRLYKEAKTPEAVREEMQKAELRKMGYNIDALLGADEDVSFDDEDEDFLEEFEDADKARYTDKSFAMVSTNDAVENAMDRYYQEEVERGEASLLNEADLENMRIQSSRLEYASAEELVEMLRQPDGSMKGMWNVSSNNFSTVDEDQLTHSLGIWGDVDPVPKRLLEDEEREKFEKYAERQEAVAKEYMKRTQRRNERMQKKYRQMQGESESESESGSNVPGSKGESGGEEESEIDAASGSDIDSDSDLDFGDTDDEETEKRIEAMLAKEGIIKGERDEFENAMDENTRRANVSRQEAFYEATKKADQFMLQWKVDPAAGIYMPAEMTNFAYGEPDADNKVNAVVEMEMVREREDEQREQARERHVSSKGAISSDGDSDFDSAEHDSDGSGATDDNDDNDVSELESEDIENSDDEKEIAAYAANPFKHLLTPTAEDAGGEETMRGMSKYARRKMANMKKRVGEKLLGLDELDPFSEAASRRSGQTKIQKLLAQSRQKDIANQHSKALKPITPGGDMPAKRTFTMANMFEEHLRDVFQRREVLLPGGQEVDDVIEITQVVMTADLHTVKVLWKLPKGEASVWSPLESSDDPFSLNRKVAKKEITDRRKQNKAHDQMTKNDKEKMLEKQLEALVKPLRHHLGRRVSMRRVPFVVFELDMQIKKHTDFQKGMQEAVRLGHYPQSVLQSPFYTNSPI